MIRVQDIKLTLKEDVKDIPLKVAKKLKIKASDILSYTLFKEAIDARKKEEIRLVYTVDIETLKERELLEKYPQLKVVQEQYIYPESGEKELRHRPVVIGSGPCGLFAALLLAQCGYKPLVIERGKKVEERVKDVEKFWAGGPLIPHSNVQFGEGGAGTFSDGKLTTQIKNKRCRKVLEELVESGGPSEILYKNKPHIGTDVLQGVVKNIRERIITLGGEFRFETTVTDIKVKGNQLEALYLNGEEEVPTEVAIIAVGHSARDTFQMLYEAQLHMEQKPFSIGMRIEHLQEWINEAQYGEARHHPKLGAAEYKLVQHCQNGRTVYSFCMCPGGYVIASASEEKSVVTNGMSEHARDSKNANSGILVNVGPKDFKGDHPLAGVELQRHFEGLAYTLGGENYKAPVQRVGDFLKGCPSTQLGCVEPSYKPGVTLTNLRSHLPDFMGKALEEALVEFGKKIKNFDHPDALLTGFETRSSSPVRLLRDETYQSNIRGLYPAGEGAGYAGGITSAAVDGIEVAEAIIHCYKKPQ